jgi:hypothetical protein
MQYEGFLCSTLISITLLTLPTLDRAVPILVQHVALIFSMCSSTYENRNYRNPNVLWKLFKAVVWNVPAPSESFSDSVSPDVEGESLSVLMVVVVADSTCLDGCLRSLLHVSLPTDAFSMTSLELRRRGPTDPEDLRREDWLLCFRDALLHRQFKSWTSITQRRARKTVHRRQKGLSVLWHQPQEIGRLKFC